MDRAAGVTPNPRKLHRRGNEAEPTVLRRGLYRCGPISTGSAADKPPGNEDAVRHPQIS